MAAEPVQFTAGERARDPRRAQRGGRPDRPLPRDHGDPPLRRPRLEGARARRPHGRHLRRPRPWRVGSGAAGTGLWIPGAGRGSRVGRRGVGGRWPVRPRRPLDGRPHRGRLRAARIPSGSPGLVVIGPVYAGEIPEDRLFYWDGLADALRDGGVEGFVAYVVERGETEPGLARDGRADHPRTDAAPPPPGGACRRDARGHPLAAVRHAGGARARWRCRRWSSPATTAPTRATPAVAEAYAERLPRARLIGEEEGESPLAWQGGALARDRRFHRLVLRSMDEGDAIHYLAVPRGTPVYGSDGVEVGRSWRCSTTSASTSSTASSSRRPTAGRVSPTRPRWRARPSGR